MMVLLVWPITSPPMWGLVQGFLGYKKKKSGVVQDYAMCPNKWLWRLNEGKFYIVIQEESLWLYHRVAER